MTRRRQTLAGMRSAPRGLAVRMRLAGLAALLLLGLAGALTPGRDAVAQPPSREPTIVPTAATSVSADPRRSGFDDMSAAIQALQRDDALNPAFLWMADGDALWRERPVRAAATGDARACQDCHGALDASMRGVAARYPAWVAALGRPLDLAARINQCRQRHQGQPAWLREGAPLLALEARIAQASRGLPIRPPDDERLGAARARGAAIYQQRMGQLDLSCAHCHDQRAGLRLGGSTIPQAHANGYPLYRLEWQTLGSLRRRLRNCLTGVRAEAWPEDDPAWTELALHLAWRDRGLPVETPAVRP